jgi:transcriptional regulator with XRE-family HTH domain
VITALKSVRMAAGLSQRALSARLRTHETYAWEVEHGQHDVRVEEFIVWCEACGADAAEELRAIQGG